MYDDTLDRIKQLLKENKEGFTLSEIAQNIGAHRNSVAKYLDILHTKGQVQVRNIGRAKLYTLAQNISLKNVINMTNSYNILLDQKHTILQHSSNIISFVKKELKGKNLHEFPLLELLTQKKENNYKNKYYHTSITPVVLENGDQGTYVIIEDITEKKNQEQQLILLQRSVESSASGIAIADMKSRDQELIYVNPAFEKITGHNKKEVLGKNCRFLQGKKTDKHTAHDIRECIANGKEGRFEILNYKKDGSTFWNELYLAPVKDKNGDITHYVGVQSDVSYRHKNHSSRNS